MTNLREGRLLERGAGEAIQIHYEKNFIQDSCQRFSQHVKSTFH